MPGSTSSQQRITRLERLLTVMAACNAVLVRAGGESELLADVCRQLVMVGGYAQAVVALDADGESMATMVAYPEATPAAASVLFERALVAHERRLGALLILAPVDAVLDGRERAVLDELTSDVAYGILMQRAEEHLRLRDMALQSSMNGVMITSSIQLDHPIVYVNRAFERMTGYSADEVLGRSGRFLVRDDLDQPQLGDIRRALRERREAHAVLRNYRKDGSPIWVELAIAPVRDAAGEVTTHFVSILNDVTERVTYQQQLEFQATHDVLTGLANRNLLNDRIGQAIALARRNENQVAVLLLDLDRFKFINDGFGHAAADDVLRQVAERLLASVRDTDTVARLGGDEFVVVLADVADAGRAELVADKVLTNLTKPLSVGGKEIYVTASIGIALYPDDGEHGETLLRSADVAMYRVKEHGRNAYRVFQPEMGTMALERLDMEGGLRRALERGELDVYYQPKLSIADGRIVGAEALVRWRHPTVGLIGPSEFIPLAEETGLIVPLGEFVFGEVCRQQRAWLDSGLSPCRVAINISARHFRDEGLVDMVRELTASYRIDAAHVELELTESMVMHHGNATLDLLRDLREIGVHLALDDFGTGYSSLSYLKRFPIHTLKIDRSFIADIDSNEEDAAIAKAIVAMAHSLGLNVVAEGVERESQLDILRGYGCDEYQGYFYSRPIPADNFALLLGKLRP